jgi:hypothetical protein
MAEPNYPAGNNQELSGHDTARSLGPHFGIIPRWVNGLDLAGSQFKVLSVIACHARKETRIARPSIETIADEANLDRRTVQRAIRRLEAKGVLKRLPGGGRGRSSEYQIIFEPAADTAKNNSGNHAAVSDAGDTANSGVFVPQTAAFSSLNSGTDAAPTDSEQKERTDSPSGEAHAHARARGDDFSDDGVDRRQAALLLPFDGHGHRRALLKRYNPSAALVDWARDQYGINALDDRALGKFIDWRIEHNRLPVDIEAIEAAYKNWIRDEATRFAGGHNPSGNDVVGGSPKRSNPTDLVLSALNRART